VPSGGHLFGLPTPTLTLTIAQNMAMLSPRSCSPAAREVHTKGQCVSHQHLWARSRPINNRCVRVRDGLDVFETHGVSLSWCTSRQDRQKEVVSGQSKHPLRQTLTNNNGGET